MSTEDEDEDVEVVFEFDPDLDLEWTVGADVEILFEPEGHCDGFDGPLPCSKPAGHPGPHYFFSP